MKNNKPKPGTLFGCILPDAGWSYRNKKLIADYVPINPGDILMLVSYGIHNGYRGACYLDRVKIIWLYEQQAKKALKEIRHNET